MVKGEIPLFYMIRVLWSTKIRRGDTWSKRRKGRSGAHMTKLQQDRDTENLAGIVYLGCNLKLTHFQNFAGRRHPTTHSLESRVHDCTTMVNGWNSVGIITAPGRLLASCVL
jgi:hypothetical protein